MKLTNQEISQKIYENQAAHDSFVDNNRHTSLHHFYCAEDQPIILNGISHTFGMCCGSHYLLSYAVVAVMGNGVCRENTNASKCNVWNLM